MSIFARSVHGVLAVAAVSLASWPGDLAAQDDRRPDEVIAEARQLSDRGDFEEAAELIRGLLKHDPVNQQANLVLGEIRLAQGLNDDAMKSFESVLTLNPDSATAREGEVRAAEAAALADRKAGLDGSALLCLIRARNLVPDSPRLLLDFGVQAEQMKIYVDAETALARAHELEPDDAKIIYALAHVQFDEQKMADAETNLRTYLRLRPDDASAHFGMGRLLHMLLRNDEAKLELKRSIEIQPRQSGSYYELGEIAREASQADEAKTYYETVLSAAPHHGGALTGLGILAFRAKDYPSAEKYLSRAVSDAPDYVPAHHYYSLVLARLGRDQESQREANLAATLDAENAKARHGNELTVLQ